MLRTWLTLLFLILIRAACAETVTLPATANAGISSIRPNTNKGHDMDLSWGSGETLAVRQNQNWSGFENKTVLLKFDLKAIHGWTVKEASLHVALAKDDLYGVGLCSVASDWREPTVDGQVEPGAPCWNYRASPAAGEKPSEKNWWAWPDSGLYSVTWLHPALRYSHAGPNQLTRYEKDGVRWLKIPVDPALVSTMAAGVSYGMVLTDDKGQVAEAAMLEKNPKPYTYDPSFEIQIYSRHAKGGALAPKLEVSGEANDKTPPAAVKDLKVSVIEPSTSIASIEFTAPGDDGEQGCALAYEVSAMFGEGKFFNPVPRYSLPLPVPGGQKQTIRLMTLGAGAYTVKIHAVDKAGNAGADSEILVHVPDQVKRDFAAVLQAPAETPKTADAGSKMSVWCINDLAKIDPVTGGGAKTDAVRLRGAKNEAVAFQLIVERHADELKDVKVECSDLKGPDGTTITASKNIQLFREWYLIADEKTKRWLPDACIPLTATAPFSDSFNIPSDPVGATQTNQAVWVDVYVPKDAAPGDYTGTIQVSSSSIEKPVTVSLALHVRPFALPDEISFPVELNTYSGMGGFAGVDLKSNPERYLLTERRFYQLAHQHRLTLNILRYTHSGRITEAGAPPLDGDGAERHVSDWSAWDARFGPLLDGAAFTEANGYYGPGMNTPLAHFYLPVHENWPMDLDQYYQDKADTPTRPQFAEFSKKSRRLEESIEKPYVDGYTNVVSSLFKHFSEKGWKKTAFQFFLNDKYYYKCSFFVDPIVGGGNKPNGRCYWLLDEPVDFDDMDANRYFLSLAKRGVEASGVKDMKVQYRTDVSNPHMVRGLWDGVSNLWDCSFLSEVASTALVRQKMLPDEKWWNYGLGTGINDPTGVMNQNFYHRYTWGCVGVLPYWANFGDGDAWKKYSDLSIYYSGKNFAGSGKNFDGAIAGLRMKAMRRAQQDIEYLNLLANCKGWDRDQVLQALRKHADNPDGHSGYTFSKLSENDLDRLRESVAATIEANK